MSALPRRARRYLYRQQVGRALRRVRRGRRDRCWCGGRLLDVAWHPSYSECAACGCYVNRVPPLAEEFARIYSIDCYWGAVSRMRGWPPLSERGELYRRDGRLEHWLALIAKYGPGGGTAVEVGCAPGVLLAELQRRHYECVGVEPEARVGEWLRADMGLDVRVGMFPDPGLSLPPCDLFLAFDVLEHVPSPDEFVKEMARLLKPGGIAIIQAPIDQYEDDPPFGSQAPLVFDDIEHLVIFVDEAMRELGRRSGLEVVSLSEKPWLRRHELCIYRKPVGAAGRSDPATVQRR